jgi:hypothetical protein
MAKEEKKRLTGVKEIAEYLDMSVSSVYRWEKNLNLPLHRVGDKDGYTVYADKDELDDWLSNFKSEIVSRSAKNKKRQIFSISLIAIGAISIFLVLAPHLNRNSDINNRADLLIKEQDANANENNLVGPEIFTTEGGFVHVKSRNGDLLWSYRMAMEEINNYQLINNMSIFDIDKDNFKEIASKTYDLETNKSYLCLFDHDGQEIWKRSVDSNQTFNNVGTGDDYSCGLVKFALSENKEILIISHWRNRVRFSSIIACHDLAGNLLYQYLNIGHHSEYILHDLDEDGVDEIIFSGTNNLLNGEGILGVLPLTGFRGISPPNQIEPEYADLSFRLSIYVPDNPIPGNQLVYIRFKRNNYLQKYQKQYMKTNILGIDKGILNVELEISENEDSPKWGLFFCFVFDRLLNLKYVIPMRDTQRFYSEAEGNGEIDIPIENFLDVLAENVLRWEDGQWVPNPREK